MLLGHDVTSRSQQAATVPLYQGLCVGLNTSQTVITDCPHNNTYMSVHSVLSQTAHTTIPTCLYTVCYHRLPTQQQYLHVCTQCVITDCPHNNTYMYTVCYHRLPTQQYLHVCTQCVITDCPHNNTYMYTVCYHRLPTQQYLHVCTQCVITDCPHNNTYMSVHSVLSQTAHTTTIPTCLYTVCYHRLPTQQSLHVHSVLSQTAHTSIPTCTKCVITDCPHNNNTYMYTVCYHRLPTQYLHVCTQCVITD